MNNPIPFKLKNTPSFLIILLSCVLVTVLSSFNSYKPLNNYSLSSSSIPAVSSISPNIGPTSGGTLVTVTGSGFISGDTVMFGSNASTDVNVLSSTEITAVSPLGSSEVDITVVSTSGTSLTSSNDLFSYVAYTPINPVRVCDTRAVSSNIASNQCNDGTTSNTGPLTSNQTINVNVDGTGPGGVSDNIPSTATAVTLNVTVTDTTQPGGFLTIYPSNDTSIPNASNINFNQNTTIANRAIVKVDTATGDINVYNYTGNTDVIIDIVGYFSGSTTTLNGSVFNPINPIRICDTRAVNTTNITSNQCNSGTTSNNGPLTQNETKTIQVSGIDNIPQDATAIAINVTVTDTTSNGGFLIIYPTPPNTTTAPNVSDINFNQNTTIANMDIVKVGNNNSINVYNAVGSADLIVDVTGYYIGDSPIVSSVSPSFGSITGGTTVTVTGTNLENATEVDFGPNPGTITSDSSTSITVTSPAGSAGTVDISVTTPIGVSATWSGDLFYYMKTWSVDASYPAPISGFNGIACPSVSTCYAVGENSSSSGSIVSTNDGGSDWLFQTIPYGTGYLKSISCPSVLICYAVGEGISGFGVVVSTVNGGASWTIHNMFSGSASFNGISCTSSSTCFAVGSGYGTAVILATTDGGTTWSTQTIPTGSVVFNGVSCPSISTCYAVGQNSSQNGLIVVTVNGGTTWSTQAIPSGIFMPSGIDCILGSTCYVAGVSGSYSGAVLATTNSGTTWSTQTNPLEISNLSAISCPSVLVCFAVGQNGSNQGTIIATTNGGTTWSTQVVPSGTTLLDAIACVSISTCYVTGLGLGGNYVLSTTDGGITWSYTANLLGVSIADSISCPSASTCYVVGQKSFNSGVILSTSNGGTTWSTQAIPSGIYGLNSIYCVLVSICYAVGQTGPNNGTSNGVILTTVNGGLTWSNQTFPSGVTYLNSISCTTTESCYAVGRNNLNYGVIFSTTTGGDVWANQTILSNVQGFNSISCQSALNCYATGYNMSGSVIIATVNGGISWSNQTIPLSTGNLPSISCPSDLACFAVGSGAYASGTGGLILKYS